MENFKAEIIESSKELTKKERVQLKDTKDCIKVDEKLNAEGSFTIDIAGYVVLRVHNEQARGDKDYEQMILLSKEGEKYLTGSRSFMNAFASIYEEMEGEDISIKVYSLPSKNYQGKSFITCSLV